VNQQYRYRPFPASNPLANALVVIVGIVVISLSLALGFFVFLGVTAFVVVMAAAMSVRNWWYGRKGGRPSGRPKGTGRSTRSEHVIIEGEYQRVEDARERDRGR
jgi:membrane protein implicated in regulation of membrane protease activity